MYSIAAASLAHTIARACSIGVTTKCSCGVLPTGTPGESFKWGGCGDDVHFGTLFSKTFAESSLKSSKGKDQKSTKSLMDLHNFGTGMAVSGAMIPCSLYTSPHSCRRCSNCYLISYQCIFLVWLLQVSLVLLQCVFLRMRHRLICFSLKPPLSAGVDRCMFTNRHPGTPRGLQQEQKSPPSCVGYLHLLINTPTCGEANGCGQELTFEPRKKADDRTNNLCLYRRQHCIHFLSIQTCRGLHIGFHFAISLRYYTDVRLINYTNIH